MVTSVITNYLENDLVDDHKKYLFIKNLNLGYGDLLCLMELYKYETHIHRIVRACFQYNDSNLKHKINKQNMKIKKAQRNKKIRKIKEKRND